MNHIGLSLSNENDALGIPDIHFVDGNLQFVTGAAAVAQHIKQRLKTHRGEWFLDREAGVPWLDELLGRQYDPALAEDITKTTISETHGVTEITQFSVSFDPSTRGVFPRGIRVRTVYDPEEEIPV